MAHAQKPDFVFGRNGRVHLNRRGASVQSTTGSRGVRISGSNAGYTTFRGSVKGTGYPLHSAAAAPLDMYTDTYFGTTPTVADGGCYWPVEQSCSLSVVGCV